MGIRSIAVYSDADESLPYVSEADESVHLGPSAPAQSYLDVALLLDAARKTGAAAVHPGYGFLSWAGPPPDAMGRRGDKDRARNLMAEAGVPVGPGSSAPVADSGAAIAEAER